MTALALCQTVGGMPVAGLAVNSCRMASQLSTRVTRSERAVFESSARMADEANRAIRGMRSSFFMALESNKYGRDLSTAARTWKVRILPLGPFPGPKEPAPAPLKVL